MIPADYIRNGGRIFFVWEIAMKAAVKQPTVIVVEGSSDAWKIRDDDGEEGERAKHIHACGEQGLLSLDQ